MTLQIEAGKYYRTRDGRKVGPMQESGCDEWPWIVEVGDGRCWHNDGSEVAHTKSGDLIAEWQDEHPAHIIAHEGRDYDLTALESPFGLLPGPVQEALQAWPHGWVHYCGSQGWQSLPHYTRIRAPRVYRAVPAPTETRVQCYRGESHPAGIKWERGTCIKRDGGSIDWQSWRDAE